MQLPILFYTFIFYYLVTGRPLRSEADCNTGDEQLLKRARTYSVVPVDGSADSKSSSTPIKTSFIISFETIVTTKVVTVTEDPVTVTVQATVSVFPSKSHTSISETSTPSIGHPLSAHIKGPTSTDGYSTFSQPSADLNEDPTTADTIATATTITTTNAPTDDVIVINQTNEERIPTHHIYPYSYRLDNSTVSKHNSSNSR